MQSNDFCGMGDLERVIIMQSFPVELLLYVYMTVFL